MDLEISAPDRELKTVAGRNDSSLSSRVLCLEVLCSGAAPLKGSRGKWNLFPCAAGIALFAWSIYET
jgi:hypothetical protein